MARGFAYGAHVPTVPYPGEEQDGDLPYLQREKAPAKPKMLYNMCVRGTLISKIVHFLIKYCNTVILYVYLY